MATFYLFMTVFMVKVYNIVLKYILYILAGTPVEGKSSECLICMKYRIIILIIIIMSTYVACKRQNAPMVLTNAVEIIGT